jgi:hypothetical protein
LRIEDRTREQVARTPRSEPKSTTAPRVGKSSPPSFTQ